jgi:predicted phosphate transport protein (TIGR00153 family)
MTMLRFLMPKEQAYFDLFENSAKNIVRAAEKLKELIYEWTNIEALVSEITEIEHVGDTYTHQIIERLNRSFITPFDREDIALLAHSLDDVTDFIHSAADYMLIYKVDRPGRRAKELADILVQSAIEVGKALPYLRHPSESKPILQSCVEINRLENVADRTFRAAIGELFEGTTDIREVIKWREIYEHMETATDRCEDVANVLEGVALKHA